jgi:hypothetical protein
VAKNIIFTGAVFSLAELDGTRSLAGSGGMPPPRSTQHFMEAPGHSTSSRTSSQMSEARECTHFPGHASTSAVCVTEPSRPGNQRIVIERGRKILNVVFLLWFLEFQAPRRKWDGGYEAKYWCIDGLKRHTLLLPNPAYMVHRGRILGRNWDKSLKVLRVFHFPNTSTN